MKNAEFNTHDVKRCCEKETKLGIVFKTEGKEYNGWFKYEGIKIARITVPKGRKPMGKGLYNSMAGQLKLSVAEFDKLLECPLNRAKYIAILERKEILPIKH
jgi:hypothetical protein